MFSEKLFVIIICFLIFSSCDTDPIMDGPVEMEMETETEMEEEVTEPETETDPDPDNSETVSALFKCDGISFTSPPSEFPSTDFQYISDMKTGWIALIPYAFTPSGSPNVNFDSNWQWWGESTEGTNTLCDYSQEYGLSIMIKPHIWISGSWIGDFELATEEEYQIWEENYRSYIMTFAEIAEEQGVDVFCIGTEVKKVAVQRPQFWRDLAAEVRAVYSGKITYAANWDNYQNVTFWDDLDFIGIDAYFPLVEAATPSVEELKEAWLPLKEDLKNFSIQEQRSITFTEYGYMSLDFTAWQNWENEGNQNNLGVNMQAQYNSYQAFFETLWNEDWFGGGFLWKWFHDHPSAGGLDNKDYTPQNKPAAELIESYFELQ